MVTIQPPGNTVGTVRFNAVAPTTRAGLLVTAPPQPPMVAEATVILVSVSVKLALLTEPVLVLPMLNDSVVMSPLPMVEGLNDLAIVSALNGAGFTIRFADAVILVLALVDVTVLVVLVMPGDAATTVLVTCTEITQLPVPPALNGIVAPLIASEPLPAALPEVTVPPQELLKLGVENTCMPDGNTSVSAAPVIAVVVDGLVRVIVIVVAVLAMMGLTLNALVIVGAAKRTANGAVAATVLPPPSRVLRKPTVGEAGIVLV